MVMSYDVRFWKTDVYRGARVTTYRVRWLVAQKQLRSHSVLRRWQKASGRSSCRLLAGERHLRYKVVVRYRWYGAIRT